MAEYQDWQGSRWNYTKQQSKWHFDTKKPPEPGHDSFTYVCRFDADFTDAIRQCLPRGVESSWSTRNNYKVQGELYSASAEEQDLINAGADPKAAIFDRSKGEDIELFQQINTYLGVENSAIKFHNQRTGQMLHLHIDNFAGREERENSFIVTEFDKKPETIRRFAIMLADWEVGQVFQLGNAAWTQWSAGDCITWEWKNIPHSTCNMGWHDRPMLQITGNVTERTEQVLAEASRDKIVKI